MKHLLLILCVAVLFCLQASSLLAQVAPYNPYAASQEEVLPAVKEDGSLHWPVFYKSKNIEMQYQRLWSLGACRGTNKNITIPVEQNKISIDAMPEGTVTGQVMRVDNGGVLLKTADGAMKKVVTHPEGVSRVDVTGDVPASLVKPGMVVRLMGSVDAQGQGKAPLTALDVISVSSDFVATAVEADKIQTITAKVISLRGQKLQLLTGAGTLRRLIFTLADDAQAHVIAREIGYASVGDELTAKGHLYSGASQTDNWVFASDVTVTKKAPPTESVAKPVHLPQLGSNP